MFNSFICLSSLARPQAPGSRGSWFFLCPWLTAIHGTNQAASKHTLNKEPQGRVLLPSLSVFLTTTFYTYSWDHFPVGAYLLVTTAAWLGCTEVQKYSIFLAILYLVLHIVQNQNSSYMPHEKTTMTLGLLLDPRQPGTHPSPLSWKSCGQVYFRIQNWGDFRKRIHCPHVILYNTPSRVRANIQ